MAVVKLSKSGKQVQFITDDGLVYGISITSLSTLLAGNIKQGLSVLTLMPYAADTRRFPKSLIWNPETNMAVPISEYQPKDLNISSVSDNTYLDSFEKLRQESTKKVESSIKDSKVW